MTYNRAQLFLLTDRLVADGMNEWVYDTADSIATVIAAGYISDAHKGDSNGQGMSVGDKVTIRRFADVSTKASILSVTEHYVTAVVLGTGATLSSGGIWLPPAVEDGAAVTLTADQSGALCIFDKTDGALFNLPAPQPGLWFEFQVDTVTASGSHKVLTNDAAVFIDGTVNAIVTGADADLAADTANGTTHRSVTMNGTTTGGIAGTRFKLVARSATVWEIQGEIIKSGSVATSFATS
jgi:hypothetical protein